MPRFMATFAALVLASGLTSVLAAPTIFESNMLSIRAADIVKNDYSTTENHPLIGLYNDWLQNSPHAEFLRRNASSVVERFPAFVGVECYDGKETCLLTSRMAMSNETVALARQEAELDHQRSGKDSHLAKRWDTEHLVTELHYKTYHWLGKEGEEEFAGFEQYIEWNWNVSNKKSSSRQTYPLPCLTKIKHILTNTPIRGKQCKTVLFRTSGGLMIGDHKMEKITNPSFLWVATISSTVMDMDGPLKTETLIATFGCAWIFGNKCCLSGGSEHVSIDGVETPGGWARPVERTCNWGKQSYDKCDT
jgi:hypothetical protein